MLIPPSKNHITDGKHHQERRDAESEDVALLAQAVQLPEPRGQDRGYHGAKIDAGVKDPKKCGDLSLLLRKSELLSAKSHNTRLDSSGAKCDEDESQTRYGSAVCLR